LFPVPPVSPHRDSMLCVALATGLVLFLGFQRVNGFVSPQVSQRRWPTFRAAASMIPAPLAAVGLKKELAARGLVVSGRKADLVARLSCADIEGSEVNDDDVDDDLESIVEDDGPDAPDTELPPWSQTNGLIDASKVPAGFRAGFVSIIGFPNAGKSTLMNHLVGDSLAVVTPSPQTTRHSIMGVATQKRHQLIYTDTPGMLDPKYMLHERMMKSVRSAMKHAEVLLAVVDACEVSPRGICSRHPPSFLASPLKCLHFFAVISTHFWASPATALLRSRLAAPHESHGARGHASPRGEGESPARGHRLEQDRRPYGCGAIGSSRSRPVAVVRAGCSHRARVGTHGETRLHGKPRHVGSPNDAFGRSSLPRPQGENCDALTGAIIERVPESPPLYPAFMLSDRPDKFFASERIREQIFKHYGREIPFSCEVVVTSFKDEPKILRIAAKVMATRESQKRILIGAKGQAVKRLGTLARLSLEDWFRKKIFLELSVGVAKEWRFDAGALDQFGYSDSRD